MNPTPTFRALSSLTPWERNYNRGDVPAIARSVQTFGFNGRLAIHGDSVMAGNHAFAALQQLAGNKAPFPGGQGLRLEEDGTWSVLVITLDHLSRSQAEALRHRRQPHARPRPARRRATRRPPARAAHPGLRRKRC